MARRKTGFAVNANRIDPYKNFKFRMAVGSVLAAVVGFGLLRKLVGFASREINPKDYLPPEPTPPPPIEGVGTTTAGRARSKRTQPAATRRR
jgi:hypothetical protein